MLEEEGWREEELPIASPSSSSSSSSLARFFWGDDEEKEGEEGREEGVGEKASVPAR